MASLRVTMCVLDASSIAVHTVKRADPRQLNVLCKWVFHWVLRSQ